MLSVIYCAHRVSEKIPPHTPIFESENLKFSHVMINQNLNGTNIGKASTATLWI